MFDERLAWYIAGPLLGLCVVACRALFNGRLGVTGGFSELIDKLSRRRLEFDWRGWFAIGVLLGGTLFLLLSGGPTFQGYGWTHAHLPRPRRRCRDRRHLFGAGILIGYGAKLSGGCTSGNGLSGTSMLSLSSLVATSTFFATAIAVSFLIEALI